MNFDEYDWDQEGEDILGGYDSDDVLHDNPSLQRNEREFQVESDDVKPEKWTDVLVSNPGEDVKFSIDTASIWAYEKCIADVKRIRERLKELTTTNDHQDENENVTLVDLFNLAFGENSEFGSVFMKELYLDKKTYLKFIGTVFLQMSYKEAPSNLYADESELKSSVLIDKATFIGIWKAIANKGRVALDAYVNESRRDEYFWVKCERASNNFLRTLSVTGNNGADSHSLDDDKTWLEQSGRNTEDTANIANVTHTRDNRKGICSHTDVLMPLLLPIHFRIQRKGETACDNFKATFLYLYPGTGLGRNLPDLNGITNHSDRGYTTFEIIFLFLIPACAEFTNTMKRSFPNPFIWGMKTSENDTRTVLDEKGCPTIYSKFICHSGRKISVHAFRTGTKNISTVISSTIHGHQWEGIALNPKQRNLYLQDPDEGLKSFYFQMLSSSPEEFSDRKVTIKYLFEDLVEDNIDVITLAQGTVDWHLGRKFSFTSSQADFAIAKAIVAYQDDDDWCKVGKYLEGNSYRRVFGLVEHRPQQRVDIASNNEEADTSTSDDEEDGTPADNGDEERRSSSLSPVESMILHFESIDTTMISMSGHMHDALAIIRDRINNDTDDVVRTYPRELFESSVKEPVRKAMTKLLSGRIDSNDQQKRVGDALLKKWLVSSNTKRAFLYISKEALIRIAATDYGKRLSSSLSVEKLASRLVEIVSSANEAVDNDATSEIDNTTASHIRGDAPAQTERLGRNELSIIQAVTKAILQRSFMKPFKGAQREHCKMGHKLELPIGNTFMKDLNESELLPGFRVISLHAAGLVAKKDHPWAKDSIDFIAVMQNSEFDVELWGIEIKSRQTSRTINLEKEHLNGLQRRKYAKIDAEDSFEHIRERSERFQILHHAYVYGFKRIALVIGNLGGQVISGTVVEFKSTFMESYGRVIKKLKEETLEWAYYDYGNDTAIKSLRIPNEIIEIANDIPTINGKEALYGTLKLWRRMFHNNSRLPLPVLRMLIPRSHAKWNAMKGGSDTTTKCADDCIVIPPKQHINNQAAAIGRCISNLTVTTLRLHQVNTSKINTKDAYPSLRHYRNAASQRCTYQTMCRKLYNICKSELQIDTELKRKSEEEVQAAVRQSKRPRRKKYNNVIPDPMEFAPAKTFKTPKKNVLQRIENESADVTVINRTKQCTGFPFEIIDHDEGKKKGRDIRRICVRCKAKTKWFCIKCRQFFCMTYKKENDGELYYTVQKENDKEGSREITKIYGKACFHIRHPAMQDAMNVELCQPCDNSDSVSTTAN